MPGTESTLPGLVHDSHLSHLSRQSTLRQIDHLKTTHGIEVPDAGGLEALHRSAHEFDGPTSAQRGRVWRIIYETFVSLRVSHEWAPGYADSIVRDLMAVFDLETLVEHPKPFAEFYDSDNQPRFSTAKPDPALLMQPWHVAWILHWQANTAGQVAFHPRGCNLCEKAVEVHGAMQ